MKISIVTDEISADLETALELSKDWGVDAVELRGVGRHRYPAVDDLWQTRVPELIRESGLQVAALSPGLFKIPFPRPPGTDTRILRWEDATVFEQSRKAEARVRYHLETLLPASILAAQQLGAKTIICFSFDRGAGVSSQEPIPLEVIDVLKEAANQVQGAGLTLAIEVEHICWGHNGRRTAEIVEKVGNPVLGINWDPANAYRAGEDTPYPDDYSAVRDLVRHVHFKDARTDAQTGERYFDVEGDIDWPGQIKALIEDGYDGFISVETHARPKVKMAQRSLQRLIRLIKGAS